MPDQPEFYRLGRGRRERDFTVEPTQDFGVKGLTFEFAQSGVASLISTIGGIANPKVQESVSIQRNVAEATPTIAESVSVDKDKVAQATETMSESVSVTVS
jgi:hypothetical protein